MATATTTKHTAADLRPVDEAPAVRAAVGRVEPLAQRFAALDARLTRFTSVLDPHVRQHLTTAPTEDETLDAYEHAAATRVEHARTRRELRQAEADLEAARATERNRLRSVIHAHKASLVARLDVALAAAAAVNAEIVEVEDEERLLLGGYLDVAAWAELAPETSQRPSRLNRWRQGMREQKLIR